MEVNMNTFKKITLAALILGAGAQTIHAHPWTTKAIAAATLTGLGLGLGTVKYYGFNTVTNAVLEKFADAKNWMFGAISNKLSNAVYGSYKNQINTLQKSRSEILEKADSTQGRLEIENRELKNTVKDTTELRQKHARNVEFSSQKRTQELAKDMKEAQKKIAELKADATQMRYDAIMELKKFHDQMAHLIEVAPQMTAEYFEEKAAQTESDEGSLSPVSSADAEEFHVINS